jgi:hypothetical protein
VGITAAKGRGLWHIHSGRIYDCAWESPRSRHVSLGGLIHMVQWHCRSSMEPVLDARSMTVGGCDGGLRSSEGAP